MSRNSNKTITSCIIAIEIIESVVNIYWTHRDGFEPVTFHKLRKIISFDGEAAEKDQNNLVAQVPHQSDPLTSRIGWTGKGFFSGYMGETKVSACILDKIVHCFDSCS